MEAKQRDKFPDKEFEVTPQIPDEEKIRLFEDIGIHPTMVGLVPDRVDKKTSTGIIKPGGVVDEETKRSQQRGGLVVLVGEDVTKPHIKVGKIAIKSPHGMIHAVIKRQGELLNIVESNYIVATLDERPPDEEDE